MCLLTGAAEAAVFTVTPTSGSDCSNYQCDLQSALTAAASNGQADILNLAAGTYHLASTLTYQPSSASGENFSLTLQGAGAGATIIDVGAAAQTANLDSSGLTDGSKAAIAMKDLTLTGSGNVTIASQAYIDISGINAATINIYGSTLQANGNIVATNSVTVSSAPIFITTATSSTVPSISAGSVNLCSSPAACLDLSVFNPASITLTGSGTISSGSGTISSGSGAVTLGNISATINLSATSGNTFTLNGAATLTNGATNLGWVQVSGTPVTLSDPAALAPTFVVPTVAASGAEITFAQMTLAVDGTTVATPVKVTASGNGISNFPNASLTFKSATSDNLGINVANGAVTSLNPVDPTTLTNTLHKPSDIKYGLIDTQIKVAHPGDSATVTVFLPAPAPAGYKWYKYNPVRGWFDFSDNAVFNADRTQVSFTLVDGGLGDDDGIANGVIVDPAGLAMGVTPLAGDCDGNGTVTIADLQSAIGMYLGTKPAAGCVNFGAVSVSAIQAAINGFLVP